MPATNFSFRPRVEPLATRGAEALGELALVELAARLAPRALVLLDGWPRGTSVLAFDALPAPPPRSLAGLRRHLSRLEPGAGDPVPGAFHGGFLGALAYELGAAAERGLRLPPAPWALPPIVGGLFTDFLVRDEVQGETHLVLGERPGDGRASVSRRARALRASLSRPAELEPCRPRGALRRLVPRAAYRRRIERVRALIAAGEVYQVNLSHRLHRAVSGEPLELYRRLRALHPAPYAAYLRAPKCAVLSASPELLLEYGPEPSARALARPVLRARTRPIKGTAARGADEPEDRARGEALLASAKDRAELAMIVDLERNDLGRIAVPGGVWVEGFPSLESYASVHHLVADVLARPRPESDALTCLAALYPGGSITGAPKLRSMEAIAALEREGRGFAYGSLLALDTRGVAWASLLIRTLLWRPRPGAGRAAGEVSYRVGGGITWGSEPAAELAEAEAKGLLLARALEGARGTG